MRQGSARTGAPNPRPAGHKAAVWRVYPPVGPAACPVLVSHRPRAAVHLRVTSTLLHGGLQQVLSGPLGFTLKLGMAVPALPGS